MSRGFRPHQGKTFLRTIGTNIILKLHLRLSSISAYVVRSRFLESVIPLINSRYAIMHSYGAMSMVTKYSFWTAEGR